MENSLKICCVQNTIQVEFLKPIDVVEISDKPKTVMHLYKFIHLVPVSRESKNFRDFNVDNEDIQNFLESILEAINQIRLSKIKIDKSFESSFLLLDGISKDEIEIIKEHQY